MGSVVTRRMKWWKEDRGLLLQCVAGMGRADVHEMGIFPDLHFPTRSGKRSTSSGLSETVFRTFDGAWLSMMAQAPDAVDPERFEFNIDSESGGCVYTESGLVAREETSLPATHRRDQMLRDAHDGSDGTPAREDGFAPRTSRRTRMSYTSLATLRALRNSGVHRGLQDHLHRCSPR